MIPIASLGDQSPTDVSSTIALSRTLWIARPWPSNSFKRMAPTAAPQEPLACSLPDKWHQQLFMHHEMWSNLTAALALCLSNVCGYSCKDVQTSTLTVRSCSPLQCHSLTDTRRCQKKKSHIHGFWTKVLEIAVPKTHPRVHRCIFEAEGVYWMKVDLE